jgi:hypothetical protein
MRSEKVSNMNAYQSLIPVRNSDARVDCNVDIDPMDFNHMTDLILTPDSV